MRFRLGDDERLYETLRTEIYLRLLGVVPKTTLSEVMRNLQKLEAMSYGEGIKQGMAVAVLAAESSLERESAIAAHSIFYADAHTPLVRRELENPKTHAWTAAEPVSLPPQTLKEAIASYGPTLEPSSPSEAVTRRLRIVPDVVEPEATHEDDGFDEEDLEEEIAAAQQAAEARGEPPPPESPDLLDRIRTQIKTEMSTGWLPKTWPEMILHLMPRMHIDAFVLDLQLSGEQGRAVLDQCGLGHISPGSGVMVDASGGFGGVKT